MKRSRWSALALSFGLSLGLAGCPESDDYELPGDTEGLEREREGPDERPEGLYGDEGPIQGEGTGTGAETGVGVDTQPPAEGPAPGEGMREEPDDGTGIRPVPNEAADPAYRDQGQTGGAETPRPQQTQQDQTYPGQYPGRGE